ncbi:armadillo-type protein [Crucibulum laeve]|uniref:V-type proton ATPase subunit H n=1 Tax=Crucibulum laeve TaxID=68775 RepID=A0A5C3MBI8_9AGAR|nr:armadillo-type protein [Crucibulum laeve]
MSISLVSNTYLDENSSKIRSKPVPWEGYQRADLVTSEELALIKKVDRQSKQKIESVLLSEGRTYALLYLSLLKKLQRVDTMQCLLVLIADALADHEERIPLFTAASETDPDLPYVPLLRTLETQDDFVQLKAAQILTILLSVESQSLPSQYLTPFLSTLSSFVQGSSANKRDVAVQCLESLLSRPDVRQAVWRIPGIISGFVTILKQSPGPQMSYQVAFCLWLLSFEQNIAEQINRKFDIIPILVDVAQGAVKEKVIRVVVATFRNLVTKAPQANLPAMLVAQLLPFVKNLASRKFSDEDILEDVKFIKDELNERFQSLTTYDEYTSELSSGHLSWTPVHESEDFWKENAIKLNDKDHEQLKTLITLLKDSNDPTVLAVAAHDVGQYVKHYDRGKKIIADLGGKARVMELMTHQSSDVRYHALLSVQQLVSQPWVTV